MSRITKTSAQAAEGLSAGPFATRWGKLRARLCTVRNRFRPNTHIRTPAEDLRRAVAKAKTWEEFGKALKDFRKATTRQGVRPFGVRALMGHSTVSDKENGKSAFEESQLRTYLHACDADEDLITFCLEHWQRIAKSLPRRAARRARLGAIASIVLVVAIGSAAGLLMIGIKTGLVARAISAAFPAASGGSDAQRVTMDNHPQNNSSCRTALMRDWRGNWTEGIYIFWCGNGSILPWRIAPIVDTNGNTIIDLKSQECLGVTEAGVVSQQPCNGNAAQSWQIEQVGGVDVQAYEWILVTLKNHGTHECITIPRDRSIAADLIAATCTDTETQRFWIKATVG